MLSTSASASCKTKEENRGGGFSNTSAFRGVPWRAVAKGNSAGDGWDGWGSDVDGADKANTKPNMANRMKTQPATT